MGMDEDSFALLLQKLFRLPFRFLTPRGPYPVEVRGEGRIGASWYAYDGDQERFRRELERAEAILLDLLREVEGERRLAPRARIVFGFSQGGYLGGYLAVRRPELFGAMIISGARVKTEFLEKEMPVAAERGFRALLCHGERDASVAPEAATRSRDALAGAGIAVDLETLDAGHSLGRAQIDVISAWLLEHFG
jgi:phospholipase/carboxylesterase